MPALDWEGPGGKGPASSCRRRSAQSARVRGAAGVCAYPAQASPPGGNGGGAAACGSAAGDDLYGAGMGVPAPHCDILVIAVITVYTHPALTNSVRLVKVEKDSALQAVYGRTTQLFLRLVCDSRPYWMEQ